jgi:hypothetical protein
MRTAPKKPIKVLITESQLKRLVNDLISNNATKNKIIKLKGAA